MQKDYHDQKKHNFYQEIFNKELEHNESINENKDEKITQYKNALKAHKAMSMVFFVISFISLTSICILANDSNDIKNEMDNNYQEMFAASLNIDPLQDATELGQLLDKTFKNESLGKVVNTKNTNIIDYNIPSNFNKFGTPVKIEYLGKDYKSDSIRYTFSNLNTSPFRVLEKSILFKKLKDTNFPGYSVTINSYDKEQLTATITKNQNSYFQNSVMLPVLPLKNNNLFMDNAKELPSSSTTQLLKDSNYEPYELIGDKKN